MAGRRYGVTGSSQRNWGNSASTHGSRRSWWRIHPRGVATIVLVGLLLVVELAQSRNVVAAPLNDNFSDAAPLGTDDGTLVGETNVDASVEPNEPFHNGVTPSRSVWYTWTPTISGTAVVEVTTHPYATWDIVLAVYTGSALDSLAEIAADGGVSYQVAADVEFTVTAGVTYHIAIDGRVSYETGSFDLTWSIPSPPNDDFANASVLSGESGWLLGETNEWASAEAGEPSHNGLAGIPARSVWYRWTPPENGTAVIKGSSRPYAAHDIVMAVYTGASVGALTEVTAWGGFGIWEIRLELAVVSGTTYHIVLDGYDEDETGEFDLTWALSPPGNDDFDDPTMLAERNGILTAKSNLYATPEVAEPTHAGVTGTPARSVWYEWTPIWDGEATVELTTPGAPDDWDSLVSVYVGSNLDSLTEIAATSTVTEQLQLQFETTPGTTYRIVVDGHDSDNRGSFDLTWSYVPNGGSWTVTKTDDTDDGACDADCSLREAVAAANNTGNDDTIYLPTGTYTLTHPDKSLYIDRETGTTTILGAGRETTIIDASGLASLPGGVWDRWRVFFVDYHAGLTLSGVTVTGGYTAGGSEKSGAGIKNVNGYLTVIDCLIEGNVAGYDGGGIANFYGTAVISNTVIRNNHTDPPEYSTASYGGGIFNTGTMTITNSAIEGNASDKGGGIASEWVLLEEYVPSVTVINSDIISNTAERGAGIRQHVSNLVANGREGTVTIVNSRILGNHADRWQSFTGAYNEGGGIMNLGYYAAVIITDSVISNNSVTSSLTFHPRNGSGGGMHNHGGRVEIYGSTIADNTAHADQGQSGDAALGGRGGGVLNAGAGRLTLTNSTISHNETTLLNDEYSTYLGGGAGGGLAHMPSCETVSSTLFCWCPFTTVNNTTITSNAADHGGGIDTRWEAPGTSDYHVPDWEVEPYSDIFECPGMTVENSIVVGNAVTTTFGTEDCWGDYVSEGYNMVGAGTGCVAGGGGDQVVTVPLLGPLSDNGGPSETHALLPGSPAIDGGNPTGCPDATDAALASDQRGAFRTLDGDRDGTARCDIGAFERVAFLVAPSLVGDDLHLTWSGSGDSGYDIWRGTSPYGPLMHRAGTPAPAYVEVDAGAGNAEVNYYFEISGESYGGDSNRIGVFTFDVVAPP